MSQYKLASLIYNDCVLAEMRKGMYGLPQAGIIATAWGYHACCNTRGLFQHVTRPITFCLVVDDFGVKYVGQEHAQHLLARLLTNLVHCDN
jgi:hypothetical protein